MAQIKQTKITIEKRQIQIVRGMNGIRGFCPSCGTLTEMMTAEKAAVVLNITEREIFRLVEENSLHFLETSGGRLFICQPSTAAVSREMIAKLRGENEK